MARTLSLQRRDSSRRRADIDASVDAARKSARATGRAFNGAERHPDRSGPAISKRFLALAARLGISQHVSVVGTRAGPTAKILALRINRPLRIPAKIAVVLDAHVPAGALVLDHHAKKSRQPGIRASAALLIVVL